MERQTDACFLKVSELKKTTPGVDTTKVGGESRPERELRQEAPPSSSSVSEELLGFTPASELYSVGISPTGAVCFSFPGHGVWRSYLSSR